MDAGGVSELPVTVNGGARSSWDGRLALGSMTLVSSEIGTIQPVADFAALVHASGGLAHSDAAQAIPTLEVSFAELGLDLMSVGGHKVGAPAGIGVLLARRGIPMATPAAVTSVRSARARPTSRVPARSPPPSPRPFPNAPLSPSARHPFAPTC